MHLLKPITILLIFALLQSCKQGLKYHYAIRDFREALQPALGEIVSKGFVDYYDTTVRFIKANASDRELMKMSRSELPVLRAAALRLMTERPSIDNFKLILEHLDDTAIAGVDHGEWGVEYHMVADVLIHNSKWATMADKNRTIDSVVMGHNNLESAYFILYKLQPEEKYYAYIKKMAQQDRSFDNIEDALYALAKYKRKKDVFLIKEKLLRNMWRLGHFPFRLLQNYPDTAYLEVFDEYSKKALYKNIKVNRSFVEAQEFFSALASYQTPKSAEILGHILNRKPFLPPYSDSAYLLDALVGSILDNKCEAYMKLEAQIKPFVKIYPNSDSLWLPSPANVTPRPETDRW